MEKSSESSLRVDVSTTIVKTSTKTIKIPTESIRHILIHYLVERGDLNETDTVDVEFYVSCDRFGETAELGYATVTLTNTERLVDGNHRM